MSPSSCSLSGRMAIVVGAGHGIGQAIAVRFAQAGAKVGCLDHDLPALHETARLMVPFLAASDSVHSERCDVTDESSIAAAVAAVTAKLGAPRVLVNGAAANEPTASVLELAPADWNRALAVNLTGAYLMSRAVLPAMIAAGGGSIIHIASQLARVGVAGRPAYCATKGALVQLAKAMALDHARDKVRVNTLSPGAVETRRLVHRWGDMEAARRNAGPLHPIGRLGQPAEIAEAALFLASDASSFMTGADLLVDGGYTAL